MAEVIIDLGATATEKGGMVFNVKAYGATGDGITDDKQAFIDAIAAANQPQPNLPMDTNSSGRGGVVYVPQGVYIVGSTLTMPAGVSIRGAGMNSSQIRFRLATTVDGFVWSSPGGNFAQGGFMEDLDILAASYASPEAARNLVVLEHWSNFAFHRVRVAGAYENNIRIIDSLNISGFHVVSRGARRCNLWIGAASETVTTTCRFVGCYFQNSLRGPCVDVAGLGLAFDGCIFESAGHEVDTEGYGARVRGGTVTFTAPYFEANRNWDLIAGTDVVEKNGPLSPSVVVINPLLNPAHDPATGALLKATNSGALKFERGRATVLGGNFYHIAPSLVFSTEMDFVNVAGNLYYNPPAVEGGTLADLPGTVLYKKHPSGQVVQAGDVIYGPNP